MVIFPFITHFLDGCQTVSKYFCRLELKGNKYVLGEFLDFDGVLVEEIKALKKIKRSKVSHLIVRKTSTFGFGNFSSIYCNFCLFCGQLCQNIILKNLIFLRNQKLKDRENGAESWELYFFSYNCCTVLIMTIPSNPWIGYC